jgi:N-methylhydantoinase A
VSPESIEEIVHGTTVATNAVLQHKGAKTALITTRGFRDVLELRRMRVPSLYSLLYEPPKPLVERSLRLEVTERIGADGEIVVPLDLNGLDAIIQKIRDEMVEAVAVCFLHSYRYPDHELAVGAALREALPDVFVSLSVDVLPEIREYERTSTTVVNAYLGPIVKSYTDSLVRLVESANVGAPVRIMQSNGGIMSARRASQTPVQMLESGPAAGVIAADDLGSRLGLKNIITFDMGGTTAKAALIENGSPSYTTDYEIGAGISLSSKLVTGGGHAVKVPVIDLAEVGAGGGSIIRIDSGGALKVGPQSAGASPGPACYDTGGTDPTVTDANLVLGYINPSFLAGGEVELTPSLAESAMQSTVAGPLGVSLLEAAYGAHAVANVNMIRAIRAVSTYRGRDPRDFALLAFGGSGPIHAAGLARSLRIKTVVVPPAPGLFSAIGLLQAKPEHHFVRTYFTRVADADLKAINKVFNEFEQRSTKSLVADGYDVADVQWLTSFDVRYVGQAHELTISLATEALNEKSLEKVVSSFHDEHDRTYGHKAEDEPTEIVNLRLTARSELHGSVPTRPAFTRVAADPHERSVYFGPETGTLSTPVIDRGSVPVAPMAGPLIVEEYDATTVVPPDCSAHLDELNNIVIDVALG